MYLLKNVFLDTSSFQYYIAILTHETQSIGWIQIRIPVNGLKAQNIMIRTNSTPDRVWQKPSQSMLRILIQCIKPNLSVVASRGLIRIQTEEDHNLNKNKRAISHLVKFRSDIN